MIQKMTITTLFFLFVSTVSAQYPVNWVSYDFINLGSDVTRSAVFNPQTDHVLVATRYYAPDIMILDAATGDSIGKMNTENVISTGTAFPLNVVDIADDGVIYVCNNAGDPWLTGNPFRVYRFADESAVAELIFEDNLDGARYGDAFAVAGSGENTWIYASGMSNPKMVVINNTGGSFAVDSYINLPQPGNARHGISPVSPGGKIWVNGADSGFPPPTLLAPDGTLIATVPDTILSAGGSSTILHLHLGQYKIVSVINAYHNTVSSGRYFEDAIGTVTFDYFGDNYFSNPEDTTALYHTTGRVNNVNASGTLSYDSKRHSLIVMMGWNCTASISLDKLIKASTPRDSIWTVSVDGALDFYPVDHVGTSNGRDLYMTWASGKFFVGVTGHTLVDPEMNNRMYIAFDLDPDGANGSESPPEAAGGVQSLPFPADVVFMVESWNEADYLIGTIYKWNGSAWESTFFDGNIAAEGALAYADEGEGKLAEFSAIMNEAGIGTAFDDLSFMVYVAGKEASGEVLCAFPAGNPVENGVEFGAYYYIPELGSGMFPTDTNYVKVRGTFATAIDQPQPAVIQKFDLGHNYPNPFNAETVINYAVAGTQGLASQHIELTIYNVLGQKLETLVSETQPAGKYAVRWDASDYPSGVYYYQLTVKGYRQPAESRTSKMVLIK